MNYSYLHQLSVHELGLHPVPGFWYFVGQTHPLKGPLFSVPWRSTDHVQAEQWKAEKEDAQVQEVELVVPLGSL